MRGARSAAVILKEVKDLFDGFMGWERSCYPEWDAPGGTD